MTAESIITNERYIYIASIIKSCYKKKSAGKLSTSDKIDKCRNQPLAGSADFCDRYVHCLLCIGRSTVGTICYRLGRMTVCSAMAGICSESAEAAYEEAAEEYVALPAQSMHSWMHVTKLVLWMKLLPRMRKPFLPMQQQEV